ncbi:MAG TPA: PIG-L family deacetylase [Thermoanaerobaculia bacterium]|nr:PIG-L family deacetylase [Thermoanaerobaculia bacterium]
MSDADVRAGGPVPGGPVPEESLIPYQATELAGARILVLAAHPDDEVLGPGGAVALAARRAEAVRVWIATDGGRQEGVAEPEAEYAARRREESRRAAEILGTSAPLFGGLPDRELSSRREDLKAALAQQILGFHPDLVLSPSPVEIHPDHRALGETLYELVAASRSEDADHDRYRLLSIAYYELSHPMLPNTLVDIAAVEATKREAIAAFVSQQGVRDYGAAMGGLNAYRRLTLSGDGPVEAFRVVSYAEASTNSLEELRREMGPAVVRAGERAPAPLSVVVRTRNRPELLKEALASLAAQTARPEQVVVVNDGGASPRGIADAFRSSFEVTVDEAPARQGRSAAANRGVAAARRDLVAFLDDDDLCYPDHVERLVRAQRSGPEPVVYSDAVTASYARRGEVWEARARTLQYSLDFDPEYLLLANYIPLHTLILPRGLFEKVGGFDPALEYSEDWDFLIRLSFETSFRHLRAVTCEYRVFDAGEGESGHAAAASPAFQEARRLIYERYRGRRSDEGLARALDRMRAQISFWYDRDRVSQGELVYQRDSHRKLNALVSKAGARLEQAEKDLAGAQAHIGSLSEAIESDRKVLALQRTENVNLNDLLTQIYKSRVWRLHLWLDRLRGRG